MAKINPSQPRVPISQPEGPSIDRRLLVNADMVGALARERIPKRVSAAGSSLKGRVSRKHPSDKARESARFIRGSKKEVKSPPKKRK